MDGSAEFYSVGRFAAADYVILAAMLCVSTGIGIFYACTGGKQSTTREFLLADRSMSPFPVAMSLVASFISAITVLGTPAEVYLNGSMFWLYGLSYIGAVSLSSSTLSSSSYSGSTSSLPNLNDSNDPDMIFYFLGENKNTKMTVSKLVQTTFTAPDYVVLAGMLVISAGIGVFHACTGGRQSTTEEFLVADRKMNPIPVSMSLVASFISAITVLGTPAETYVSGCMYWLYGFAYMLVGLATGSFFIPIFYNVGAKSANEVPSETHLRREGGILDMSFYDVGTFTAWDYVVLAIMLSISAGIGLFYGCTGSRQSTTKEFLLADGNMNMFPVAMSLVASFISAITVLGTPSEMYLYGSMFWLFGFAYIGAGLVSSLFLPVFLGINITSANEGGLCNSCERGIILDMSIYDVGTFGTWDYVVLAIMLSISAGIGLFYGCTGSRQSTTKEFLLADGNMNMFPVAMSLVASFISAITVLGTPSEVYIYGGMYWLFSFGYMGAGLVSSLFLPVFMGINVTISAGIGLFFACTGGRQSTMEEFLMADRSMNPIPVSMSLLASFISAVTVLGTPAETYVYGCMYWLFGLAYIMVGLVTAFFFIPIFYHVGAKSANENPREGNEVTCEKLQLEFSPFLDRNCIDKSNAMTYYDVGTFEPADYAVFSVCLGISAGIGVYYGCTGGKQSTTKEFLLADRNMHPIPVSLSLVASFISAVTVLGTPAENYLYGCMFWLFAFAYILSGLAVSRFFLPVFLTLNITSANEYLEMRFNRPTRILGTLVFFAQMILYLGIVVYAPALALNQVTGLNLWGSVMAIGLVCTFYTTIGGMKAVLWTDVFQVTVMMSGFLAVIIKGSMEVGGLDKAWQICEEGGRIDFWDFSVDPTIRHTFWSVVVGGTFTWGSTYGVNQSQVQRYLTCGKERTAQWALFLAIIGMVIVVTAACLSGLVMYANFVECDPYTMGYVTSSDQLMPYFVMYLFGSMPGLPGLFTSAVFSAALSTVSSGLNSLAAVTAEDIVKSIWPDMNEKRYTLVTKSLALFFGALCIAMTYVASQLGGVLQAALSIFGMIGGPMLGLYSIGMFFPWANSYGAIGGTLISLTWSLWVGIGAQIYPPYVDRPPLSTDGCNVTMTTLASAPIPPEERPPIAELYGLSYAWYSAAAWLMAVFWGLLISFLTGATDPRTVNPKLICPIVDRMYCCLPESIKKPLRCHVGELYVEEEDEKKEAANEMEVKYDNKAYVRDDQTETFTNIDDTSKAHANGDAHPNTERKEAGTQIEKEKVDTRL
ncbi:uncharacterized protein [Diadema setosum]|uniref:uncharacterized protein n=1 Tax=Diadema setosum TaxID=31175 RepID=UPI003B3A694F